MCSCALLYASKIWFTSSILQQINITKYLLTYFFLPFQPNLCWLLWADGILSKNVTYGTFLTLTMTIRVVEFSNRGEGVQNYKVFILSINIPKGNYWILSFEFWINGELSKSAKIWLSKIIRIFLNFFFIEEYQIGSTFFVIDIFW